MSFPDAGSFSIEERPKPEKAEPVKFDYPSYAGINITRTQDGGVRLTGPNGNTMRLGSWDLHALRRYFLEEESGDSLSESGSDPVNHPDHYTQFSNGAEVIDITENLNFNVGNAVKYLARAGRKTEDPVEDLRKAAWYVNRELDRLGRKEQ